MEQEVREFLRATEVLLARLKTGKPMSQKEVMLVQSYSLRATSLVSLLKSYDCLAESRNITQDLHPSSPSPPPTDLSVNLIDQVTTERESLD